MLFGVLAFAAVVLTYAMFQSRNSMLGFPSALMWAILGGYAYNESTVIWDIYFIFAFACLMGMTIFCMLGAYGLREKRDTLGDKSMEKGDGKYVDEQGKGGDGYKSSGRQHDEESTTDTGEDTEDTPRSRATARRRTSRPKQKGEFDFR